MEKQWEWQWENQSQRGRKHQEESIPCYHMCHLAHKQPDCSIQSKGMPCTGTHFYPRQSLLSLYFQHYKLHLPHRLQDMHPRMVMHPYRPDLNGQDLSDYRDPRGKRIFAEFADVVRRRREGLVAYVWQWPDDCRSATTPRHRWFAVRAVWAWCHR